MADTRKVELILGIRAVGATDASAGIDSITNAAQVLSQDLSKLERADALKNLGVTAATVAAQTGELERAALRTAIELKSLGATEKEIRLVSREFDRTTAAIEKARAAQERLGAAMAKDAEKAAAATKATAREVVTLDSALAKIGRADEITALATKWGNVAKKTKDATTAAAELKKELQRINATESEIQGAAGTFTGVQQSGRNALARIGSEVRNLPSQRIEALGIGTDAIGNFARLGGALQELFKDFPDKLKAAGLAAGVLKQAQDAATNAEKVKTAATVVSTAATNAHTTANTTLATSEGAATAGAITLNAAILPVAAIGLAAAAAIGAVAAALGAAQAQSAAASKAIVEGYKAQATVDEFVRSGATTQEALAKLADIQGIVTDATERQTDAERRAAEDFRSRTGGPFGEFAARLGDVLNVKSLDEGFNQAINENRTIIQETTPDVEALTAAIKSGEFAANDAKKAEEELAKTRTANALATADNAGKEVAARQRADNATAEANEKRLQSIEDEKTVIQAQIDSLTQSGEVSKEVTDRIAALNGQLGLLGQESSYISETALAASKARDAEKKAADDAKKALEENARAQEQQAKAIQSANTTFKQATEDIGIRLRYALIDNAEKTNRDLAEIGVNSQQELYDLSLKAYRDERNAALDQTDDLKKIRESAAKDEAKALESGNFRDLYFARLKGEESLKADQEEFERERQLRTLRQEDALADLQRSEQRQRDAKQLAYHYGEIDARNNQQRELQAARLTHNRALALAAAGQNAGLQQIASYWKQFNAIQAQGIQNALKMTGASTQGANSTSPFGGPQGKFVANMIGQIIK